MSGKIIDLLYGELIMSEEIKELKGQTALVTGGSRGIGNAIARKLVSLGVNVALTATTDKGAQAAAAEIGAFGLKLDVTDADDVASVFGALKEKYGSIDILVNNAGITRDTLLMRMKEEDWDAVMDTNLKGAFLCTKEAIKIMAKARYGRIINITSVVGFIGNAGQVNYSASKAGIMGLTKTVAREYASRGITVNAVAPGFIVTAMTDAISDKVKDEMLKNIPLGKFGQPQDIADSVGFFASPGASYITGQVLHVNGGMYM
jgi:3-oxoacyl-[acyl-carrier protein] reductase